jgi:nicotinamidase-related amidase
VAELAGPMNRLIHEARRRGAFVLHAPSTCVNFYKDTPARKRAQQAPMSPAPAPLSDKTRWGTGWCWPDPAREPDLPIDDSDMGCDCAAKCTIREAWTREIATIEIDHSRDAIADDGQETVNLLAERGIRNVVLLGVHLNMCVLGRPFAIRQMVHQGRSVALVRDMTDTMYNSKMRPTVNHFAGTDLVVEHIEKYWCPSFTSADIVGGAPFRFEEDRRK